MLLTLIPHPTTPSDAVERLQVAIERPTPTSLSLHYDLVGDLARIVIPSWTRPSRADELWRTTCFEAFASDGDRYFEFNLSPSGQWAAYRFDAYREGMSDLDGVEITDAEPTAGDGVLALTTVLHLDRTGLSPNPWRVGLSAVIEEVDGAKSYWALAHASDKPDFHHPDSFVLELS